MNTNTLLPVLAAVLSVAACSRNPAAEPFPQQDGVVQADEATRASATTVEQLLKGKVAGVEVITLPNGEIQLRIRGVSSVNSGTEPLIIIDDMPVLQGTTRQALSGLNPKDIDHIDVLKDPASTARYGARGTNGVILIHTRRKS